ncbi:MAG TPA: LCP family protein [Acidimicrobiales bacterium]|nr:LCP family protein [Acidimicrobiales bacterium]
MFEHLDDPHPPALGAGFRRDVVRRARRRRRRRYAGGAGVAVAALVAGAGGLYGRAAWRLHDIERVDTAGTGAVPAGAPVTALVVGLDSGPGREGARTDTVLLAHIDPGQGTAALLSLPRDLIVDDPGTGAPAMLNAVVAGGGLDALVRVVEDQIGVPVDHVVEVTMEGVASLVDAVGGIEVWVPASLRDRWSGLFLDEVGCVRLDGDDALALVRSRHLEVLDPSGGWTALPYADIGRVANQQAVLVAALAGAAGDRTDPVAVDRLVAQVTEHVRVDPDLDLREMVDLARAALGLDPAAVSHATLPVVVHPDDENRLAVDMTAAPAVIEAFVAGRPLPAGPLPAGPPPAAAGVPQAATAQVDMCPG